MIKLRAVYLAAAIGAAVMAAAVVLAGPGQAADKSIGGNCCLDLEERIAELEATTANKGNRKVSLTISGWVAEQVMWWDDGEETNMYVGGIGKTLASHVKFTGEANINASWSAGYVLQLEANSNDSLAWNQDGTGESDIVVRQSYWFLKSKELGKISVGQQSTASDNAAMLVDQSGSMVPANWVMFDNAGFFLRSGGVRSDLTWGDFGFCHHSQAGIGGDCNGVPLNAVRYDSPTFAGFSVSASWGEDDVWDVAARYAGDWGSFKVAASAAYSRSNEGYAPIVSTDDLIVPGFLGLDLTSTGMHDTSYAQFGAYVQHMPTGLFVYGAYGREFVDDTYTSTLALTIFGSPITLDSGNTTAYLVPDDEPEHWYLKAGIRERWMALGHTVLYAEYGERHNMINPRAIGDVALATCVATISFGPAACSPSLVTGSEVRQYGVGVVQEIDAAAMALWLSWRRFEGSVDYFDYDTDTRGTIKFDDLDVVKAGALINF